MTRLLLALLCLGCADSADDAPPEVDAAVDARCEGGRAVLPGPFTCAAAPETVRVGDLTVFRYEASHPLADATRAFPCAASTGVGFEAPLEETEACSRPGVRPWHSVRHEEAAAACARVGFRLCTAAELLRACQGPDALAYPYGETFDPGVCNVRGLYSPDGAASEAPTGALPSCVSAEGGVDLNGNLWEWVADEAGQRRYQGAGWRLIAEEHRPEALRCDAIHTVPAAVTEGWFNADVGFRCCQESL